MDGERVDAVRPEYALKCSRVYEDHLGRKVCQFSSYDECDLHMSRVNVGRESIDDQRQIIYPSSIELDGRIAGVTINGFYFVVPVSSLEKIFV